MTDYIINTVIDQCDLVLGAGVGATIGVLVALALTVCLI
jgi:hypothetical protein